MKYVLIASIMFLGGCSIDINGYYKKSDYVEPPGCIIVQGNITYVVDCKEVK